jgi:hypothetical protein
VFISKISTGFMAKVGWFHSIFKKNYQHLHSYIKEATVNTAVDSIYTPIVNQ